MTRRGLLPLLLVLAGCATPPPAAERTGPLLEPPLPPASLGHELARGEVVTSDYGERSYSIRVELEVTAERLVVVGLSLAGAPLFTLEQTAAGLSVQSTARDQLAFDPTYMLSDLQLVHWPASVLAEALAARGLELEDRPEEGLRRVIGRDGQLLVEIDHETAENVTTVCHLDYPYRLRIETIAEAAAR